jgi:hypothetical protein
VLKSACSRAANGHPPSVRSPPLSGLPVAHVRYLLQQGYLQKMGAPPSTLLVIKEHDSDTFRIHYAASAASQVYPYFVVPFC